MTNKLTLPIEVGKKYVRRDGATVTARPASRLLRHHERMVYIGPGEAAKDFAESTEHVWAGTGLIEACDKAHPHDLVADYIEPDPAPDHTHVGTTCGPATTAPSGHPKAHLLRAIADGVSVQFLETDGDRWTDKTPDQILVLVASGYRDRLFRLKPKTITINGHEVPEPLRVAPVAGTTFYVPRLDVWPASDALSPFYTYTWDAHVADVRRLEAGLVHLTSEAAEAHARALLSFTKAAA